MPPSADLNFRKTLSFAHQLADASASATLRYFRKLTTVQNKLQSKGFDPVTEADKAAEKAMVTLITRTHPDHGVIGEEFGTHGSDARYTWVLDPIDGTRAFIMGLPTWGTLIGLRDGNSPVLGMMNQPFTGERYWSSSEGAHLRIGASRAARLRTRSGTKLSDAILASTDPALFTKQQEKRAFNRLSKHVRMTRFGGDCYNYCLLAAGHIDLVVETGLNSYDIVALIPIIERAGGVITTWQGAPATNGGQIIAAGSAALHKAALKHLN